MQVQVIVKGQSTGIFGGTPQSVAVRLKLDENVLDAEDASDLVGALTVSATAILEAVNDFGAHDGDEAEGQDEFKGDDDGR